MGKLYWYLVCILFLSSCSNDINSNNLDLELNIEYQLLDSVVMNGEYQVLRLANGQTMYMDRDSTFFLGDIIFTREQIEKMNTPQQRAVVLEPYINYWPNKKIHFYISPGFSTLEMQYITHAISILEQTCCIDFVPSVSMSASPCIIFAVNTDKNESPIGMNSSMRNTIKLKSGGFVPSTVIHEVMHSLGFFHEHSRNDRDEYVIVYRENVKEGKWHNFEKIVDRGLQAMNLSPFDFESIMIYESDSFAIDGTFTITKLDGSYISRTTRLSQHDKAALNFLYGPKPILTTSEISNHSYQDNNCVDESVNYSNVITFEDLSGESVELTYPRLLLVDYYRRTKVGEQSQDDEEFFDLMYLVIPAGTSHYVLPDTEYVRQEDLGVNRYYKDEYYSVRIY